MTSAQNAKRNHIMDTTRTSVRLICKNRERILMKTGTGVIH